jgi:hypothetical protein
LSDCQQSSANSRIHSPSGHFVVKDTRVGSSDVGLEALVQLSNLRPIGVESLDVLVRDTSTQSGLLKSGTDGTHSGLRCKTGQDCMSASTPWAV